MKRLLLAALLPAALAACAAGTDDAAPDPQAAPAAADVTDTDVGADATAADATDADLSVVLAGDWRDPANAARDQWRHPAETLAFFGLQPDMTVVEITPGGGWYAELLAPYLRGGGEYIAAIVDPAKVAEGSGRDYQQRSRDRLEAKFAADPERYDAATVVAYDPAAPSFGPDASADLVLTFRNVHNWLSDGKAQGMFDGFFDVLRPGGTLGVVEHRAADGATAGDSGYVGQEQVVAMAEQAGFVLEDSSEINANPADTKDHPNGVWTLPPTNNHDDADAAKYQAIGESDRMTLRFRKPG